MNKNIGKNFKITLDFIFILLYNIGVTNNNYNYKGDVLIWN